MAQVQTLDITRFIDERKMNWFNAKVVILCFFIILFDGYDIGAIAYAGPSLVRLWHISSMAALGTAFSAGLIGILFGSPVLGWIGDHYGRITALVVSCLVIGVFSLLTMAATGLTSLIVYRFITGIGIGGMLPNVIALNAEFAPRRARATMVIVMFTGITFGGAVPGPVAAWLVPTYGWQVLFLIGGVAPLIMAIISLLWLPESLKFLVVKADRHDKVERMLRAMTPTVQVNSTTRFIVPDERVYQSFRPSQLFADGLHLITPLLWVCFICNLMAFYFVNSWLPTVLTAAHVPTSHAALSTSIFQIGGTLGGLSLSRPIDKMGLGPVCVLFIISIATAPFLGFAQHPEWLLMSLIFITGFTLLGPAVRAQHDLGPDLSDLDPRQRFGLGLRHRPLRLDLRADRRRRAHRDEAAAGKPLSLPAGAAGDRDDLQLHPGAALFRPLPGHGAGPARHNGRSGPRGTLGPTIARALTLPLGGRVRARVSADRGRTRRRSPCGHAPRLRLGSAALPAPA